MNDVLLRDYKAVLVVTDSVYHSNDIFSVEDLNDRFKGEPTDMHSEFYKYVAYHIVSDAYDYSEFANFTIADGGKNIETYIGREFISVQLRNDSLILNPLGTETLYFDEQKSDIFAYNGYIHEVNGLMPISEPLRFAFIWEPTEWDEFRTIEFYREPKEKGSEEEEQFSFHWFKQGEVPHIRWKTIPFKEEAVGYASVDVDWDRFWFDDCFWANLGPVGWVEFDTPTIMCGKYHITLEKWAWSDQTGISQMYIDGKKFGTPIDGSTDPKTLDMGTFTFIDSGTHVFRFNIIGGAGHVILDRFTFTPLND